MQIVAIIPTHNEQKAIADVVRVVKALGHIVLVINDGSTDKTSSVARAAGAEVVDIAQKSGKGNALRVGFDQARRKNAAAVICLDGDGQHDPQEIPNFINAWQKSSAGIVNGDRMHNPKGMPLVRLMTNRFMSWIISCLCHQKVADTQCGYRLIDSRVLDAIKLQSNDFEIETEILIEASRHKFKIVSVPIKTIYSDEVSKIRPLKDTMRFISYIFRHLTARKSG